MKSTVSRAFLNITLLSFTVACLSCGSSGNSRTGRASSTPLQTSALDSGDDAVSQILWQESNGESPEQIQAETLAPRHYGFMLPVRTTPLATYFYGPRIFSSYAKSAAMENGKIRAPVILVKGNDHPLDHLLGKRLSTYSWELHGGIDFPAKEGTPLYAIGDGVVFIAGKEKCYGETVVISHQIPGSENLVYAVYGHLQKGSYANLKMGDPVTKGTAIAKSGSTGGDSCVDGSHLHFELRTPAHGPLSDQAKTSWPQFLSQAVLVNPADYIKEVDDACQKRKNLELANAAAVQKTDPWALFPMSAGRCSLRYESRHATSPALYHVEKKEEIRQLGYP